MTHPAHAVFEIGGEVARAKTPRAVPLVLQAVRDLVRDERQAFDRVDAINAGREVNFVAVSVSYGTGSAAPDVARNALANTNPAQIKVREERSEQRHDIFRQGFNL